MPPDLHPTGRRRGKEEHGANTATRTAGPLSLVPASWLQTCQRGSTGKLRDPPAPVQVKRSSFARATPTTNHGHSTSQCRESRQQCQALWRSQTQPKASTAFGTVRDNGLFPQPVTDLKLNSRLLVEGLSLSSRQDLHWRGGAYVCLGLGLGPKTSPPGGAARCLCGSQMMWVHIFNAAPRNRSGKSFTFQSPPTHLFIKTSNDTYPAALF